MPTLYDTIRHSAWRPFEKAVLNVLSKTPLGYGYGAAPHLPNPAPPYEREFHPQWIYRIRNNNALINNAIEEKVQQVVRRGLAEWEEEYIAKCPFCEEEFTSEEPFRDQLGEDGDIPEEIDFTKPRPCPNDECPSKGETAEDWTLVEFLTPDPDVRDRVDSFLEQVNAQDPEDKHLEPSDFNSVGQDVLGLLREVAWDVESFDDLWLIFERSYLTDQDGRIIDWEVEQIIRGPPEAIRYVVDPKTGEFGGRWYVCVECRAKAGSNYRPEEKNKYDDDVGNPSCSKCGNHTYDVYATASSDRDKQEPEHFYIRGEFYHDSLYLPSRYYGYPPVLTLWDEARTLEQMDKWYHDAYEERRAPKGALIVSSTNDASTRAWNKGEMEKLRNDPNHIPLFVNDIEEGKQDPLKFVTLLETPAEMQHMEMREWFLQRISAKYGVTAVLQKGTPENSGLSQSMEIQVANRAAERLRRVLNDALHAILLQLKATGWVLELAEVEEEDEAQAAQLAKAELENVRAALEVGLEVEWTDEGKAVIRPGKAELQSGGDDMGMGMGFGFPGAGAQGPPEEDGEHPGNDGSGGEPEAPPRPPEPPSPEDVTEDEDDE